MLREFVQDVGCGSDRIRTEIELHASLFGSGNQSVGSSLVSRDVHIASLLLGSGFYAVSGWHRGMGVVSIVESCLHHLDVVLCNLRFLGEFLAQEVGDKVEVAVEEPANDTECKHVAALQHRLVVHSAVSQAVLHHRSQRALHHAVRVDAHLAEIVGSLELSLLQVLRTETVCVDDDCSLWLGILVLSLEGGGVHSHQHVALVTRREHTSGTDVHLESRHTCERALRGADICRIVGERRNAITHSG